MQKARDQAFPLRGVALSPLVGMWFQVQCPPLVGVLPIFRSRYSFAIGRQRVLSLAGWSPLIRTHFHVLSRTQDTAQSLPLSRKGLSPAVARLSRRFGWDTPTLNTGPTTPSRQASKVWALPLSLAATDGIDFSFSSSG